MTLYEILSLTTPVCLTVIGYILTDLKNSVNRLDGRITNVEKDLSGLQKEVFFIKGLIEGKKSLD